MLEFGLPTDVQIGREVRSLAQDLPSQVITVPVVANTRHGKLHIRLFRRVGLGGAGREASYRTERTMVWEGADTEQLPRADAVFAAYAATPSGAVVLRGLEMMAHLRAAEEAQLAAMQQALAASQRRLATLTTFTDTLRAAVAEVPESRKALRALLGAHPWRLRDTEAQGPLTDPEASPPVVEATHEPEAPTKHLGRSRSVR